jgi:biotin carboxyl carrier protein
MVQCTCADFLLQAWLSQAGAKQGPSRGQAGAPGRSGAPRSSTAAAPHMRLLPPDQLLWSYPLYLLLVKGCHWSLPGCPTAVSLTCLRWDQPSWSKDAEAGATTGQVVTPMPGKVVKVLVANGQSVEAGQQLLVLEAMKMEHAVAAPRAGTVAGLAVTAGSQVEDGQVLLAVEAAGELE